LKLGSNILWIEGKRAEGPSFIPNLQEKGYSLEVVTTGSEALARLMDINPDLVVVNAASMRSSGKRICYSIREQVENLSIILIACPERLISEYNCANVILVPPFTLRKLVNRIDLLLPDDGQNLLQVGPIWLDTKRNRVRCLGRNATLTPRQTRILQILMQNVGSVLERNQLFREVWKTEYVEDTRTLDVHISWLRRAIEEDPRSPEFLKTVRGVGYRLDV
jgi:DNA-binding response OmpR family regulator